MSLEDSGKEEGGSLLVVLELLPKAAQRLVLLLHQLAPHEQHDGAEEHEGKPVVGQHAERPVDAHLTEIVRVARVLPQLCLQKIVHQLVVIAELLLDLCSEFEEHRLVNVSHEVPEHSTSVEKHSRTDDPHGSRRSATADQIDGDPVDDEQQHGEDVSNQTSFLVEITK